MSTRTILYGSARHRYLKLDEWPKWVMDLRFFGKLPYEGEVVVYEDKCAFTVFGPELIVTTITNPAIANTMRQVFEELWARAGKMSKV